MTKIRSIMLCDEIRREDNGKELIIGVYSGGIRFFRVWSRGDYGSWLSALK